MLLHRTVVKKLTVLLYNTMYSEMTTISEWCREVRRGKVNFKPKGEEEKWLEFSYQAIFK